MSSDRILFPDKHRRIPRKGLHFLLVRSTGFLFKVIGLLLMVVAVIGFIVILVRISPTLVASIQHLDQRAGGFTFLLSLVYLLLFPIIGCVGGVVAGIGFGLSYLGTEASVSESLSGPDQVQRE
jgi:cytochrome b561